MNFARSWIVIFSLFSTNAAFSQTPKIALTGFTIPKEKIATGRWQTMVDRGEIILKDLYNLDPSSVENEPISKIYRDLGLRGIYQVFINNDELYGTEKMQMDMMTAIASVFWYLSDKGGVQSESIAYNIKDRSGILFKFIKRYIEFVISGKEKHSPTFLSNLYEQAITKTAGIAKNWYLSGNSHAYVRDPRVKASSHLTNIENEQWGIDFRARDGSLLKILPKGKAVLIVAQFKLAPEESRLYLKPEMVGLGTTSDMLSHTVDFLQSQGTKAGYRGEKIDKNSELVGWLQKFGVKKQDMQKPLTFILKALATDKRVSEHEWSKFETWLKKTFGDYRENALGCEVVLDLSDFPGSSV